MNEVTSYDDLLAAKAREFTERLAAMEARHCDPTEVAQVMGGAAGLSLARDLLRQCMAQTQSDLFMVPTGNLVDELARRHGKGMVLAAHTSDPDQSESLYFLRYVGEWPDVAGLYQMLGWHLARDFHDGVERAEVEEDEDAGDPEDS